MSRSFSGTDQFINTSSSLVTGYPMSIACWANPSSLAANFAIVSVLDSVGFSQNYLAFSTTGNRLRAVTRTSGGSFAIADTLTSMTVSTWSHCAGVFSASNSRAALLNGEGKGTNTTNAAVGTLNATYIGGRPVSGGVVEDYPGLIAEVGVWNIALSDADVASLAKGFSPRLVRPDALRFYAPLIRDLQDIRGGLALTNTGTTVADHPRIYP